MERLDITADPVATEVIGNLKASNGNVVLQIFKAAAERLDYLFARHPTSVPLPETVIDVLGDALDDIEEGVEGRWIADDVFVALAVAGIFMHMGPSTVGLLRVEQLRRGVRGPLADRLTAPALGDAGVTELEVEHTELAGSKREPSRIVVDVANDQVVVRAKGSIATYNWRAGAYDNRVARLSIQPTRQVIGASQDDTYRVVAGDVADAHRPASILADNLAEAEAVELIERIHTGVKVALGIAMSPVAAEKSPGPTAGESTRDAPIRSGGRVDSAAEYVVPSVASSGGNATDLPQVAQPSKAARLIAWAESLLGETLIGAAMIVLIIGLASFAFLFLYFVVTDLSPWVVTELTAWGVL